MASAGSYTAEDLSFRAGVPLRTVRFHLQEKLIDPPLGRGRGAHFTDHHLAQLQQARTLQNAGFSLDDIRERRGDLSLGLRAMAAFDSLTGRRRRTTNDDGDIELNPDECLRVPMAAGVELLVSRDRRLPSPKQLVDIAFFIRKVFGEG
jgi:DNA-binding transcriptional MerR regulator